MELIDTIGSMISSDYEESFRADYEERFRAEYQQLKIRLNKLYKLLDDYKDNKLAFELKCPIELLEQQYLAMYRYMEILDHRAMIEGIIPY